MNLSDYQELSRRTKPDLKDKREEMLNCALGLAGECGELLDIFKKKIFHGHYAEPREFSGAVIDEMGDFTWYFVWFLDIIECSTGFCDRNQVDRSELGPSDQPVKLAIKLNLEVARAVAGWEIEAKFPHSVEARYVVMIWRYFCLLAYSLGFELSDIYAFNVAKLVDRYPEGFSKKASQRRRTVVTGQLGQ